jgi:glycosyltransferase involved in cell wall biosynthesis
VPDSAPPDVALVSLGTTPGLRRADDALAELLAEAGATCRVVRVRVGASGRLRRHPALTDLVEALAARRAARRAEARAIVYSTVTAALLQPPRPRVAVRFDSPAALNRPGWAGAWQRRRERAALGRATLLLPWGEAAAAAAREVLGPRAQVDPLPVPIDEVAGAAVRGLDAVAYAGYPRKRGLDLLCAAWAQAAPAGARLAIGGLDRDRGLAWLRRAGTEEPAGVEWLGALPREEWLATVARARLFVNASRWEDHGLSQLEALAAGCALVTVPSPGAYEALPLARELAPELVARDLSASALAAALRAGLSVDDAARAAYAERARDLLAPYGRDAVLATLRERVLPALLGGAA